MTTSIRFSLFVMLASLFFFIACEEEEPSVGKVKFKIQEAGPYPTIITDAIFTVSENVLSINATNIEGEYTTEDVASGTVLNFEVHSASNNYFKYSSEIIIPENKINTIPIFLTPKPKMVVSCFNSLSEFPLANATLELLDDNGNILRSRKANSVGILAFTQLRAGHYYIKGIKEGYEPVDKYINFFPTDNQVVDVILNFKPLTPLLAISTSSLDFGMQTYNLPIEISNLGRGILNWEIPALPSWLSVTPSSGTLKSGESIPVNIIVDRTLLPHGTFNTALNIHSNDSNAIKTISIIGKAISQIVIEPSHLNFGTDLNTLSLFIRNGGTGYFDYRITNPNHWITLSQDSGRLSNDGNAIQVSIERNDLSPNNYTGQLFIHSPSAPQTIEVSMVVKNLNSSQLTLSDDLLDFEENHVSKVLTITNTGNNDMYWSCNISNPQWLTLSRYSGTLTACASTTITTTVIRNGLSRGNYENRISFVSNGGNKSVAINMQID